MNRAFGSYAWAIAAMVGVGLSLAVLSCAEDFIDEETGEVELTQIAAPLSAEQRCHTIAPSPKALMRAVQVAKRRTARSKAGGGTIDVYFHVLRAGHSAMKGNVPDAAIEAQVEVLNDAFAESGWSFELAEITRTTNQAWFAMTPGSVAERNAKTALRKGGPMALNVYSASPGGGQLGWATFPWGYQTDTPTRDGVVVMFRTLPIDTIAHEMGHNAVHQVGHWMGLVHTFDGGCSAAGDHIDDTPPQGQPSLGCPATITTCGGGENVGAPLADNFMDLLDDACATRFTPGQNARIDTMLRAYRGFVAFDEIFSLQ